MSNLNEVTTKMESIRIGNDINVEWSILREGQPEDFSDKAVTLIMKNHFGEETEIEDFTIEGNIVKFTYFGKDQKYLGVHNFTLYENKDDYNMSAVDTCQAFTLVDTSCKASIPSEPNNVKLIYMQMTSDFKIGEGGTTIIEINVVDNLESTSTEDALSANMGRVLKGYIDDKQDKGDYALKSDIPDTSNLATKSEVSDKVDKEKGKSLVLDSEIERLSTLSNYNDTDIKARVSAVERDKAGKDEISDMETKTNAENTYQKKGDYSTKEDLDSKQDRLASGQNIKTINGNSILGEGNIQIEGGGGGGVSVNVVDDLTSESSTDALSAKQGKVLNDTKLGKTEAKETYQKIGDYALKSDIDNLATKTELNNKVDKINGKSLVEDSEIARLKKVQNYDDTDIKSSLNGKVDTSVYNEDKKTFTLKTELTTALSKYVEKVIGKDLSTNDFTNVLKQKLEGLENYNDEAIQSAIDTLNDRVDTLIGPGATQAIDTFKEIETFLQGITDKKTLAGLLLDLKQEIVAEIPTTLSELTDDATHRLTTDTEKSGWNAKLDDAPSDTDKQYVRQGGRWAEVTIPEGDEIIIDKETPVKLPKLFVNLSKQSNKVAGYSKTESDKRYSKKSLVFNDVEANNWVSDTTHTDYGFKCDITCEGVLSTDYSEVIFNIEQATSGDYAPICKSDANVVTIYSKKSDAIIIPTIIIHR